MSTENPDDADKRDTRHVQPAGENPDGKLRERLWFRLRRRIAWLDSVIIVCFVVALVGLSINVVAGFMSDEKDAAPSAAELFKKGREAYMEGVDEGFKIAERNLGKEAGEEGVALQSRFLIWQALHSRPQREYEAYKIGLENVLRAAREDPRPEALARLRARMRETGPEMVPYK